MKMNSSAVFGAFRPHSSRVVLGYGSSQSIVLESTTYMSPASVYVYAWRGAASLGSSVVTATIMHRGSLTPIHFVEASIRSSSVDKAHKAAKRSQRYIVSAHSLHFLTTFTFFGFGGPPPAAIFAIPCIPSGNWPPISAIMSFKKLSLTPPPDKAGECNGNILPILKPRGMAGAIGFWSLGMGRPWIWSFMGESSVVG